MCGIMTGNVKKLKENGSIKEHLRVIDHRGTDSYGMVSYSPKTKKWTTFKSLALKQFTKAFNKLEGDNYAIIHNRARSIGGVTLALAHPIITDKVAVIHNGTNKAVHTMINGATSDTEAISMMQGNAVDFTTTFKWLDDLGVVFTVDLDNQNQDIHLHRDKIRPLVLHKETNIIASEPLFDGEWADILEQDTYVPLHHNKITHLEFTNKFVPVEVFVDEVCDLCKKRHLHSQFREICNVCLVRDKELPKEVHYNTKTTMADETADILKQAQMVHGYVNTINNNMIHVTVFNSFSVERRKELIGYVEPKEQSEATWLGEKLENTKVLVPKGAYLHWLFKDYDGKDKSIETVLVFGYVTKDKHGNWYVVEDNRHDIEVSSWYQVYAKKVPTSLTIPTDGFAYAEDNFVEYLATVNNKVLVDMTDTYVMDKDTLSYWEFQDGDLDGIICNSKGDYLMPMSKTW